MSLFAFPCIYLNLGAEMIFVLEQRLEAQGATEQKTQKGKSELIWIEFAAIISSSS